MKRSTPAVLAALVALSMALAVPAQATDFNSTISIGQAVPLYHGKVRSRSQSECEPDRRVLLYRKVKGPDSRLGRDRTDMAGKWKVEVPAQHLTPGNQYYAIVRAQHLGNQIYCEFDKSPVVTFAGD